MLMFVCSFVNYSKANLLNTSTRDYLANWDCVPSNFLCVSIYKQRGIYQCLKKLKLGKETLFQFSNSVFNICRKLSATCHSVSLGTILILVYLERQWTLSTVEITALSRVSIT